MKIPKKAAAIALSASIAAAMISPASYAEGTAFKLYAESESASVGETASVSVTIDVTGTSVAAIDFTLVYDTEELEFVEDSFVEGEDLGKWIGDKNSKPGEFGFHYAAMDEETDALSGKSVLLMSVSFKVLKPNAQIAFGAVEICAADFDGTDITDLGSVEENVIVKCSHKNTEETVTEATCKDEGQREVKCTDCGEVVSTETIAKTGNHTWNGGTVTTEPTCTEKGVKTFTCSVCNETKTEEIAALGHSWNEGEVTAEPTCTENGTKTFTCSVCSETKIEEIAALGHDWGEWTVTKEATTAEDGEETRECSICGENETRTIAKLPPEAPAATTPVYTGGFSVPETAAASAGESETAATAAASAGESETVGSAASAGSQTTAAAAVTDAPSDNAPDTALNTEGSTSDTYGTAAAANTGNAADVGNVGGGNSDGKNVSTGVLLSLIPAAAAAVGIILSKKRK